MAEQEKKQEQVHPAAVAQEFMRRSDMKGGEVEVYAQTFNWLGAILNGGLVVLPKENFEELTSPRDAISEYALDELDAVGSESEQTE